MSPTARGSLWITPAALPGMSSLPGMVAQAGAVPAGGPAPYTVCIYVKLPRTNGRIYGISSFCFDIMSIYPFPSLEKTPLCQTNLCLERRYGTSLEATQISGFERVHIDPFRRVLYLSGTSTSNLSLSLPWRSLKGNEKLFVHTPQKIL